MATVSADPIRQSDADCVAFLQWALPELGLRWRGFRKVRGQVNKRLRRRLQALGLPDLAAYRSYLDGNADEWSTLRILCRITISRYYRNRRVFDGLAESVLPELASLAVQRGDLRLRCWSAGCASGEEVYTVAILWRSCLASRYPELDLRIVGTDVDERVLERARAARFEAGSLRELPASWREAASRDMNDITSIHLWVRAIVIRSPLPEIYQSSPVPSQTRHPTIVNFQLLACSIPASYCAPILSSLPPRGMELYFAGETTLPLPGWPAA